MNYDIRFLDMRGAGRYIGRSYRWMQRNWVNLVRNGVTAYRVPKDSKKGRLMFSKTSLDQYVESCRMSADFDGLKVSYRETASRKGNGTP